MKTQTITLRDGRRVKLRGLRANENERMLRDYINSLVKEKAYLVKNELISLKKQREWLKKTLGYVRKGNTVYLGAFYEGRLAGSCEARRDSGMMRRNVEIGVSVSKNFRRAGLASTLK